jgi:hypothetical protein
MIYYMWYRWFAWHPIKIDFTDKWVWLRVVERMKYKDGTYSYLLIKKFKPCKFSNNCKYYSHDDS